MCDGCSCSMCTVEREVRAGFVGLSVGDIRGWIILCSKIVHTMDAYICTQIEKLSSKRFTHASFRTEVSSEQGEDWSANPKGFFCLPDVISL